MSVTVEPARSGDKVSVPVAALLDLGVDLSPEATAAVTAQPWALVSPTREVAGPLGLVVAVLAAAWQRPRRPDAGDVRPSVRQAMLAQQLTRAAGGHAAGLVAHVCAAVLPAELGTRTHATHAPRACLDLYEAWAWTPSAVRDPGEAERVAWRLGTCLRQVRWVDATLRQAQIAGALALWEAWREQLPGPTAHDLADALVEAWDAVAKTRAEQGGTQ